MPEPNPTTRCLDVRIGEDCCRVSLNNKTENHEPFPELLCEVSIVFAIFASGMIVAKVAKGHLIGYCVRHERIRLRGRSAHLLYSNYTAVATIVYGPFCVTTSVTKILAPAYIPRFSGVLLVG